MLFDTSFHLVIANCTKTRMCTHPEQIYKHCFLSKHTRVLLTSVFTYFFGLHGVITIPVA